MTASMAVRPSSSAVHATVAAHCANLVGIGIARFGYTPLIPALIAAGWFLPSAAVYLGAANLAGYLAGALGARLVCAKFGPAISLRGAMLMTALSLIACAAPLGFLWFFVWRFVSGFTGGMAMALAAPAVMPIVPPERRGLAGGAIFTGVGLGIAASGSLVPLLIPWGLAETWIGLGVLALVLTGIAWGGWPDHTANAPTVAVANAAEGDRWPLRALYIEYALNAVGLVPHMVFLVDFIARGLGQGLQTGAHFWVVFGIGALIGPIAGGQLGDRIGFQATLRLTLLAQIAAVAAPLLSTGHLSLLLSSFVAGASVPGVVAVTLGRMRELLPTDPAAQAAAWSWCTIAFAIGQAIAGYGFSYLFARFTDGYTLLFGIGVVALLLALTIDLTTSLTTLRPVSRE
jgi:predicted MFS family arabinose efflux permease